MPADRDLRVADYRTVDCHFSVRKSNLDSPRAAAAEGPSDATKNRIRNFPETCVQYDSRKPLRRTTRRDPKRLFGGAENHELTASLRFVGQAGQHRRQQRFRSVSLTVN